MPACFANDILTRISHSFFTRRLAENKKSLTATRLTPASVLGTDGNSDCDECQNTQYRRVHRSWDLPSQDLATIHHVPSDWGISLIVQRTYQCLSRKAGLLSLPNCVIKIYSRYLEERLSITLQSVQKTQPISDQKCHHFQPLQKFDLLERKFPCL